MFFSKNLTISVRNTAAQLSEPLYVYEKDRNLIMYFKIMDHKYKFDKNPTNVLASMDDIMSAYVIIVDPNGYELTHQNGEVIDDEIKFVITDELIDEITEIGTYQLQFHIKCEHSEFTIPPISFEVLERLKGIKSVTDESEVGDVITNDSESFIDEEGKLQIVWQKGDTISSVRLNQMVEVINNAVDEEHLRKLNEQERVAKENERVTKENERIANEGTRTASENTRIENENTRVTSESTRLSNEAARIANEDERKAKETLRQSEENKRQTNEQTRIQNEENRVTAENARVASMNDITTRFNDLIVSLPQYPEVIDARDGEVSLKARLDRDIEKAKQVYVNVEGSYITTDSSSGYAKDVEILGNTLVNLATAHTVVGTGSATKYTFDGEYYSIQKTNGYTLGISFKSRNDNLEANKTYTIIINNKSEIQTFLYDINYNKISTLFNGINIIKFTPSISQLIRVGDVGSNNSEGLIKFSIILLEGDHTQNPPSYFEGIASVGDKVEGQELYEIPVLSVGKNGVEYVEAGDINIADGTDVNSNSVSRTSYIPVKSDVSYVFSDNNINGSEWHAIFYYDVNKQFIKWDTSTKFVSTVNGYVRIKKHNPNQLEWKPQFEEGTVATPYEPYQEDKLTILSPVQLEKVGDVADRIIEKDGVWGVEKNVETVVLDGSEDEKWVKNEAISNGDYTFMHLHGQQIKPSNSRLDFICDKLVIGDYEVASGECISKYTNGTELVIKVTASKLSTQDVQGFKQWLQANPVTVVYQLATPTFIPLPHDQQVKLRTFANKTNISFLTEIEGTIKAQVPKSLGATVNTHTEQINNLNKELDRVKKLEESTVSIVETESDFTTVEATSNGYFEDVKLEGRTLVNLAGTLTNIAQIPSQNLFNLPKDFISKIKPNTVYTVYCNTLTGKETRFAIINNMNGAYLLNETPIENPSSKTMLIKFTSPSDAESYKDITCFFFRGVDFTEEDKSPMKMVMLEGDHTQNPPSYFEGLKSVGDGTDEIVVLSNNKNLFNGKSHYEVVSRRLFHIQQINDLTEFTVSCESEPKGSGTGKMWVFLSNVYKDGINNHDTLYQQVVANGNGIEYSFSNSINIRNEKNYKYIYLTSGVSNGDGVVFKNIQIERGLSKTEYIPSQSDKKRLLYYNNETQTWEKPILRQWDSIEKHADGKYYYHQRSGEVVLNGSENWSISGHLNWTSAYCTDYINMQIADKGNTLICDRLTPHKTYDDMSGYDLIGITVTYEGCFAIKYLPNSDTKPTPSDVKQWLQANNVTVVYQLAQEKVYECTNIDLITYANETNYIVNCGPIVPRTTLKVHNNISNVVSLLQKKVSVLESNITAMFRAVLAGDYQTLAYSLYPGDFNNRE